MSAHLDLAKTFLDRVWTEGDAGAIYEYFTDAAQVRGLEEPEQVGPRDFHDFQRMMTAQFRDIQHTVHHSVEDGDWIALLCDVTAVYRETGTPVNSRFQMMIRIEEGRIAEAHHQVDLIPIFEAIGRLPPRTTDLCLLGATLDVKRAG